MTKLSMKELAVANLVDQNHRKVVFGTPKTTLLNAVFLLKPAKQPVLPLCTTNTFGHRKQDLIGFVGWDDIATALIQNAPETELKKFMRQDPPEVEPSKPIARILKLLGKYGFVMFRTEHNIWRLVSVNDVAVYLGLYQAPIMRVAQIEIALHRLTEELMGNPEAERILCRKHKTESLDWNQLYFSDYVDLLGKESCREILHLPKGDYSEFLTTLNGINELRNDLAHFRRFRIHSNELETIEKAEKLLELFGIIDCREPDS